MLFGEPRPTNRFCLVKLFVSGTRSRPGRCVCRVAGTVGGGPDRIIRGFGTRPAGRSAGLTRDGLSVTAPGSEAEQELQLHAVPCASAVIRRARASRVWALSMARGVRRARSNMRSKALRNLLLAVRSGPPFAQASGRTPDGGDEEAVRAGSTTWRVDAEVLHSQSSSHFAHVAPAEAGGWSD
jgi:hypothetical protein